MANMRVFFSTAALEKRLSEVHVNFKSGYGHVFEQIRKHMILQGIEEVDDPDDADIELYIAQPMSKLKPDMHPSAMLTMLECSLVPQAAVESLNRWDVIINPSKWGKKSFEDSGVEVPIEVVALGANASRFHFIERPIDKIENWTYIVQCVQLLDRKNALAVLDLFMEKRLPSDARLIIKTMAPTRREGTIKTKLDFWITSQVRQIEQLLTWDEMNDLLAQCHVSVNPSRGEGWGMLPQEHMLTGMPAIITNYSGFTEWANPKLMFLVDCQESICPWYNGAVWGEPIMDQCLTYMLWLYEHREEALNMGKMAGEWLRTNYSFEKTATMIIDILDRLVKTVPKSVQKWKPEDPEEEWFAFQKLLGQV